MNQVRAKKNLGQHFLTDLNIARKIVGSLEVKTSKVLEVGPGMGVLSQFLYQSENYETWLIDIDHESIDYLKEHFPEHKERILFGDFLRVNFQDLGFSETFSIIGNFPYNISSQIFFKILDNRNKVGEVVGMVQKEVAQRIAEKPGTKTYGILSVLLQAFYNIEYLFTVNENVFNPPPKVKSAVVRLKRNNIESLNCDEVLFFKIVKAGFNQRRKMLRNSLRSFLSDDLVANPIFQKRPEQLSIDDFVKITQLIQP